MEDNYHPLYLFSSPGNSFGKVSFFTPKKLGKARLDSLWHPDIDISAI